MFAEDICTHYPYFSRLHRLLSSRPNVTPICLTTGVGPAGPQTTFVQPPSDDDEPCWAPVPTQSPSPVTPLAPLPRTLAEALQGYSADPTPVEAGSNTVQQSRPSLARTGAEFSPRSAKRTRVDANENTELRTPLSKKSRKQPSTQPKQNSFSVVAAALGKKGANRKVQKLSFEETLSHTVR